MSHLFKNVRVLTLDADFTEYAAIDVQVRDGIIAAIGAALPPEAGVNVIDGTGKLLMPGLVNGHFHSPGTFNKGAFASMPLEIFMLYEVPPFDCPPVSSRVDYVRTLLGAVEMLKGGVTTVHDDPFYVPTVGMSRIDAVMSAYRAAGIRATVSINMPNVAESEKYPFLRELLPEPVRSRMEEAGRLPGDELTALYRAYIERWHGVDGGRLRASVSCSAPQRVTPDYLGALSALSAEFDVPYNMHILETRLQRVLGDVRFDKSLIRYVHDEGVLNERSVIIHAIWVDADDLDLMAASGCSVAHNPICNLRLGSGIMPFRAIAERGITICLGSDELCSDDSVNMWSVMKQAALVHNIGDPDYRRWPSAGEILRCGTANGARAMRLDSLTGSIEVGKQADLVLVDLDSLAFTPLNDLRRQLVFCETGTDVCLVMVGGRIVVEDGRILTVDETDLKREVRELMVEYARQFREVDRWVTELEPVYRQMYERAVRHELAVNRWIG
ncbi:MAG: amidohydrolase family protein [Acidobacteria bacterium]|nr:amidohydrolase family protein [Acidobacteriota bacterium]